MRSLRESAGLKGYQLAEAADVDPGTVSRLENGKRLGNVSADILIRLSRALGVSLHYLATGDGPIEAPAKRRVQRQLRAVD